MINQSYITDLRPIPQHVIPTTVEIPPRSHNKLPLNTETQIMIPMYRLDIKHVNFLLDSVTSRL